jgi:hypothetical protein
MVYLSLLTLFFFVTLLTSVGEVTMVHYMFYGATSFNQDLCAWGNEMSTTHYIMTEYMFVGAACVNQGSPSMSGGSWVGPFCASTCPSLNASY